MSSSQVKEHESNQSTTLPGDFTPWRFALFLGLCLIAAFPHVWTGAQTLIFRDFGVLAYPVVHAHHESFWRGELPMWNPLSNCGVPFLAQWGTMALYPFSLFYLLLPLPWSLNAFCLGHLFLAGLGMYFLARQWVGDSFGAAFAGTAFVFNGVTLSCLIWPNYMVALGWMPWVVLLVERAGKEGGRLVIGAPFVASLQLLAGVPELVVLTWLLIAGIWFQSLVRDRQNRKLAIVRIAAIILLTTCLISAQLLPFIDLLSQSQRTVDFGTSKWSMSAWGLGNLVFPLLRCFLTAQGVYFQMGQQFMTSTYLGLTTLMFALTAFFFVRNSRVWLLAGLGVLGVVMAMGENGFVFPWFKRMIPLLGIGRYPIKFVLITSFVVPLLAAYGVRWIRAVINEFPKNTTENSRLNGVLLSRFRYLIFVAGGLILLTGGLFWIGHRYPTEFDNWPALWRCAGWRIALLVGGVGLVYLQWVAGRFAVQRFATFAILGVVVTDALSHVPHQNPTIPSSSVAPGIWELNNNTAPPRHGEGRVMISPHAEQVLLMSSVPDLYNDFIGKRLAVWSNLNLLDGIPKVNGSATLQIREQKEIQSRLYASTNSEFQGLKDFLGVSQETAEDQIVEWSSRPGSLPLVTAGQKPVFEDDAAALEALTTPSFNPREAVFLPKNLEQAITVRDSTDAKVLSARVSNHRIEADVEATEASLVVLAQSFYHSWRAYVDGEAVPLWRANVAFQVLQIPAGRHTIEVVYEDQAFRLGLTISGIALLVSCVLLVRWPRDQASPAE